MQSSVIGTLRYPHHADPNSFLFEITYRSKPFSDHVTLLSARLVKSSVFMLDADARNSKPCMMELEYPEFSQPAIDGGQWFLDALASNSGEWQDIAFCIHEAILREAKAHAYDRHDAYVARCRESKVS